MKTLLIVGFLVAIAVIIYDETAGGQTLSKTLKGEEDGVNLELVKEHGGFLAVLALIIFTSYTIEPKLAIALSLVILASMILVRRG